MQNLDLAGIHERDLCFYLEKEEKGEELLHLHSNFRDLREIQIFKGLFATNLLRQIISRWQS